MTSPRPEDWPRIRALFERALEISIEQREAFLARACGGDEAARQHVRALLESNDQAGDFLEGSLPAALTDLVPDADLSGLQLGPYRLEARIGRGGMGEVYRAFDSRLHRMVAIKVLSWQGADAGPARERFELEARAVAALSHSHICTLHDVGTEVLPAGRGRVHYLVMELLHGETLADRLGRGALGVPEALEQAIQIAEALECAHRAGIVHQDLKPGNVMLTPSGAKLLDFGLARTAAWAVAPLSTNENGPAPITVMGTPHYMAPEQLEGGPVDGRADLFAFGCVLYEMLTGGKAVEGVLGRVPPAPKGLDAIINRCLAKDPGDRWQTAGDLRAALQHAAEVGRSSRSSRWRPGAVAATIGLLLLAGSLWVAVSPSTDPAISPPEVAVTHGAETHIAVLPLRMVGSGPGGDEHLGVGIADSIIARLASVRRVGVRPTTAVLGFAESSVTPAEAAAALVVDEVLVGTIQRSASAYRISVQLVRGRDGAVIWARTYDVVPGSLLSIQDTVAEQVADALRLDLTPGERDRLRRRLTTNVDAYDQYLRGRASLVHYSEAGMSIAIDAFERAIAIDPHFEQARAGLAMACAWHSIRFAYEPDAFRWGERADREARAALASDPSLAEAMLAVGSVAGTQYGGFDWPVVIDHATRALVLDPTLDLGHVVLMRAFFHMGLFERMAEEAAASRRLDPLGNVEIARLEVAASLHSGAYGRAREQATVLLARTDAPVVQNYLGLAQFYSGDAHASRGMLGRVMRGGRPDVRSQAALAGVEAAAGDRMAARRRALAIEQGPYMDHHVASSLGGVWAQLGDAQASVKWLQLAADTGFPAYPWFVRDPMLDPIRADPAFVSLLERLRQRHELHKARFGTGT
jgi:serine/threonine protein kinase